MNITQNFKSMSSNLHQGARNVGLSLSQRILRLVTGFFIGIVLALIIQEFTGTGNLVLLFFTSLFMFLVYRVTRSLTIWQIVVLDVFCVLVANTLRMYVMLAP